LKWVKGNFKLSNGPVEKYYFKYDWAKTVSIDDDRVFCAGGAYDYNSSDDAFTVNVKTGDVEQMPKMTEPR